MMTVLMSNIYQIMDDGVDLRHLATGFIGVFETTEKATTAWNEVLKSIEVPSNKEYLYDSIGHTYLKLDANGKWVPSCSEKAVYVLELMNKQAKLDVRYES